MLAVASLLVVAGATRSTPELTQTVPPPTDARDAGHGMRALWNFFILGNIAWLCCCVIACAICCRERGASAQLTNAELEAVPPVDQGPFLGYPSQPLVPYPAPFRPVDAIE
jgi:hypothetical protein